MIHKYSTKAVFFQDFFDEIHKKIEYFFVYFFIYYGFCRKIKLYHSSLDKTEKYIYNIVK